MEQKIKNKELIFAGIWLLFTGVLFIWTQIICRVDSLSTDTFYQMNLLRHTWKELFYYLSVDYSPPLYSIVLKVFTSVFGTDLVVLRTFSTIILAFGLFIILFPFRKLMGETGALAAASLFISSTFNLYFGVEVRPAVLAYVLTMGMFTYAAFAYFEGGKKNMILFTVFACLSMYTHNVSLIAAFCIYGTTIILALLRKKRDVCIKFLISGIIVAVLYVPWLFVLMGQYNNVVNNYWEAEGTFMFASFIVFVGSLENWLFPYFSFVTIVYVILLPVIILLFMIEPDRVRKARKISEVITKKEIKKNCPNINKLLYLMLMVFVATLGFFLFTVFVVPVFVERYFYILSGAGILVLASIVSLQDKKKIFAIIFSVLVLFTGVCNTYKEKQNLDSYTRLQMIEDVTALSGDSPVFIHPTEYTLSITDYAFPNAVHYATGDIYSVVTDLTVFNVDINYIPNYDSLWDYTDEAYFMYSEMIDLHKTDEQVEGYCYAWFDHPEDVDIEVIGRYTVPYMVDFDGSETIILRATRK